MINLLSVYSEYDVPSLNKSFYYYFEKDIKEGSRVLINFKNRNIIGFVLEVKRIEFEELSNFSYKVKEIIKVIDDNPILNSDLLSLSKLVSEYYLYSYIGVLNTMLPPSLKPSSSFIKKPKIAYNEYYYLKNKNYIGENKNEIRLLSNFINKEVLKKDINKSKTLSNLISKGVIDIKKVEKYRYNFEKKFDYESSITLNESQNEAYKKLINSSKSVSLLKGVTGSGKTEVYLKLIEKVLNDGKNVILLVPEIALTSLMISRVISYFKDIEIAVLHSGLSNSLKYDEYRKIRNNKIRIVIGTRSCVFAPLDNIGLIIIDEEHDESYKQNEDLTYNAKEIALLRLKIDKNIKILLGSATPSIDTYYKCKKGLYDLIEINNKFYNDYKVDTYKININDKKEFTLSNIFSNTLIQKIKETLDKKKQIIILINNRGYSNFTYCKDCGYIFKCPICDLSLIYHKKNNSLMCHHCNYKINFNNKCPKCGSNNLEHYGLGIEKVVDEFNRLFKETKYLVLSSDEVNNLKEIDDVINKFNNKEYLILLGTQIVSKGHDFKECDLVGIINIDSTFSYQSFKSNELGYDLISQTLGRCGRKNKGEAVIQTSNINNEIIDEALNNDYEKFYNLEIERRKKYLYPPFIILIKVKFESSDFNKLSKYLNFFEEAFNDYFSNSEISKPTYIFRYQNLFRSFIYIKTKNLKSIRDDMVHLIEKFDKYKELKISFDFSPFDI